MRQTVCDVPSCVFWIKEPDVGSCESGKRSSASFDAMRSASAGREE